MLCVATVDYVMNETLTGWGLDSEKTYSFKGEYLEEQKMVVFCLKTMNL